jgi:hypothetical protein
LSAPEKAKRQQLYSLETKNIKLLKAVELYLTRRLKAIPRHMDFVREKGTSLTVSLLKTLRLEPFFLFISLVEATHWLGQQKYASAVQKWVRGA